MMRPGVIVKRPGRLKMLTGHCLVGRCEGTKPKSSDGKPWPTCEWYQTCPCKCHKDMDDIFEISKQERVLVKSDYVPDNGGFAPIADVLRLAAAMKRANPTDTLESASPANLGPITTRYAPTPTGRKARGQLEYQVLEICKQWNESKPEMLTPKYVSEAIATTIKGPTPSTGAVCAVWERWDKLGFCKLAKKPIQVTEFPHGVDLEYLENIKATAKRNRARAKSASKRGIR